MLAFLVSSHAVEVRAQEEDTITVELSAVEVAQRRPLKVLAQGIVPAYRLSTGWVEGMPQIMGASDALRVMQTLPAVTTSSELTSGMFIQGCGDSQNRYEIDGAPVINPSHMLGLFSTYNSAHFSDFLLTPTGHGALNSNFIGGQVEAHTPSAPDTLWRGTASIGIIDARASLRTPIRRGRNSLALSVRRTYIGLLFPQAIKLDHAVLKYGFTDVNATFLQKVGSKGSVRANLFYSGDNMRLDDKMYDSNGRFGWENLVISGGYENERTKQLISFTRYHNRFFMRQAGLSLSMPSAINVLSYRGRHSLSRGWTVGAELIYRSVEEQQAMREGVVAVPKGHSSSFEGSIGGEWNSKKWGRFSATAGFRATMYSNAGFTRIYPMPRVAMKLELPYGLSADASAGLQVQCSHMVKESNTGLPCDFWINASRRFKPQTARAAAVSLSGRLPLHLAFRLEGYYRNMSHLVEYTGSVFNMINQTVSALDEVAAGHGHAYGLSITVMRVYGALQGWIGYNLGTSRVHIPALSDGSFPANHDRRHDLKMTLSWQVCNNVSLSANFVYATGMPYTQAKFGYMIGENLVCEYYPHNSSRLPDYKRLDLGCTWTLPSRRVKQKINVSLYNCLFFKNVLFQYPTYSAKKGLRQCEVGLKTLIPSVSYTITL